MFWLVGKKSDLISFNLTPRNLKTNSDFAKTLTNKLNFCWKKKNYHSVLILHLRFVNSRHICLIVPHLGRGRPLWYEHALFKREAINLSQ